MTDYEFLQSMRIKSFPTDRNWLSDAAPLTELQPSDIECSSYSEQLEARIAWQSAEIAALRQMLRSEHERHARATRLPGYGTWARAIRWLSA